MTTETRSRLRACGAVWKAKPGKRFLYAGEVIVNGVRQRFRLYANERKTATCDPDLVVLTYDQPVPVQPKDDEPRDPETGA